MTADPRHADSYAGRIDAVCDEYEAGWKSGHGPRIEDLLGTIDSSARSRLLRELLLVEWELVASRGAEPQVGDYLLRFPEDSDLIRQWWAHRSPESPGPRSGPSPRIGPYKLLEKIGEGGFGEVWMAEQREPVRRRVAVKLLKLGMDSRQVVARFEAERQALAMMEHPNIAKFLDAGIAGTSDSGAHLPPVGTVAGAAAGRPYFVMELIRGIPITDYCDQHELPTAERLKLFIQVCRAVQHAHQKGIIHRDIKPSNILVTQHDGSPVPKVIDFGIAKALQQELTDKTIFTQFQQFIGTPAYVSPEQAELTGLDIDTRADIYSLGVLLYELLTGHTPFDTRELVRGGIDSLRKTIREQEPMSPSRKFGVLDGELRSTTAKQRRTEAETLTHQLRGDLDWIVMKCLEKDRSRRYATATELSDDVARHLANEPVEACPPSTLYRFRKLTQRHRLAVGAGVLVTLAVLLGAGVSLWQAVVASRARDVAHRALRAEANQHEIAQSALATLTLRQGELKATEAKLRDSLYAANMRLIQLAWSENDIGRIKALLGETADHPDRGIEWYYWQRMIHRDLRTFSGHADRVWAAAFSPNSQRLVTGGDDNTAKIWDVATSQEPLVLRGHQDRVRSVAFSPDGQRVLTGSKDSTARIWDARLGTELLTLRGHREAIRSAAFSLDGRWIVTASQDGTARIWDAGQGVIHRTLNLATNWLFSALFSPDGQRVVTGGEDGTTRVWEAETGREIRRFSPIPGVVRWAAFSPDGRRVVSVGANGCVRIYSLDESVAPVILEGHHGLVYGAAFSPSEPHRVVTTGQDRTIRLWDTTTQKELHRFVGHSAEIYSVNYAPDGTRMVSASDDGTAKIWPAAPTDESRISRQFPAPVSALAISSNGRQAVAGLRDGTARAWLMEARDSGIVLGNPVGGPVAVAYSPDNQRIAVGGPGEFVRIWDATTGDQLLTFPTPKGGVTSVAYSHDGKRLVTGQQSGFVSVWDPADGRKIVSSRRTAAPVFTASFSADDSRIISGLDFGLAIGDAGTGRELMFLALRSRGVSVARFSPDGRWLATADDDTRLKIWEATSGVLLKDSLGHTRPIFALDFSGDSRRIVTGSQDGLAKVWQTATGRDLLSISGGGGYVRAVAFIPDRNGFLTGGDDGKVNVYRAASPRQVADWDLEERTDARRRDQEIKGR